MQIVVPSWPVFRRTGYSPDALVALVSLGLGRRGSLGAGDGAPPLPGRAGHEHGLGLLRDSERAVVLDADPAVAAGRLGDGLLLEDGRAGHAGGLWLDGLAGDLSILLLPGREVEHGEFAAR